MPQSNRARSDFVLSVYRLAGGLVKRGTASGGSTTTLVDNTIAATPTTYLTNKLLVLRPGTATQEVRYLGAWTIGTTTWAISPALTNAAASTNAYEIYDESVALLDVVRGAINTALAKVMQVCALPVYNEELTTGDILFGDGQFDVAFTTDGTYGALPRNGSSTATGGGAGTISRSTSDYVRGSGSMQLINTGSNALSCEFTVADYAAYAGESVSVYAKLRATEASRLRLRLDDGVTVTNSEYHTGGSAWEPDSDSDDAWIGPITLSASATKISIMVRVETGGQITSRVDDLRLVINSRLMRYPIRTAMDRVHALWAATSGYPRPRFERTIPPQLWGIERGATPLLYFKGDHGLGPNKRLRLYGTQSAGAFTDDTTTVSLTDDQYEAVVSNAVALVLAQSPFGTGQANEARVAYWDAKAREALLNVANNPPDQRRLR